MLNTALLEQEFGYMKGHVYVNSSLVGMPPERVKAACRVFMDDYVATFNDSIKSDLLAKRVRAKENIANLINAAPQEIIFAKNTTEGNSIIAMGYSELKPGTNVIIADSEFPNALNPWINAHQRRGFDLKVYRTTNGQIPAQDIINMMDSQTKVVAISAVQSGWGYFADLKAIGMECRRRGIVLAVDAFQALGRMQIDVQDCCIDYLACGAFKALMGTWGAAFIYCHPQLIEKIAPCTAGYQGAKSHVLAPYVTEEFDKIDFWDDVRKLEAGSQCTYSIESMSLGIELLLELGMDEVERHLLELERHLRGKLENLPLDVVTPADPARMSGMIVLRFPPELTGLAKEIVEREHIHLTLRDGYIRMTFAVFNTKEDMDVLYRALEELCQAIPAKT